jgi:hypothetical protein
MGVVENQLSREEIKRWCLEQGVDISYADGKRTVDEEVLDGYEAEQLENPCIITGIRNGLSGNDLDEWTALNRNVGANVNLDDFKKINKLFWKNYSFSLTETLDKEAKDYASVSKVYPFLSKKDCATIEDILKKYDSPLVTDKKKEESREER